MPECFMAEILGSSEATGSRRIFEAYHIITRNTRSYGKAKAREEIELTQKISQ